MNGYLLAIGLMLGMLFSALMVFGILPRLDHSLKKSRGPFEACLLTRFFCLVVALPLYVFSIWMTVVILFDGEKGNSVFQEFCGGSYDCTNTFALGRTQFNKDACQAADCELEDLYARSGSQPLHFQRLGLGQDLSPSESQLSYSCVAKDAFGFCETFTLNGEECTCVEKETIDGHTFCAVLEGCGNDAPDQVRKETCDNAECSEFTIATDSSKEFSFLDCVCAEGDQSCDEYTCEVFTMPYFYPNTLYSLLVTMLFILPCAIGVYVLVKTQLRKVINCGDPDVYVYNQEAGMQDAHVAEDFAVGGFYEEQTEKTKYRTLTIFDFLAVLGGSAIVAFFTWLSVLVAGRVGLALAAFAVSMIFLVEGYRLVKYLRNQSERVNDKVSKNRLDRKSVV